MKIKLIIGTALALLLIGCAGAKESNDTGGTRVDTAPNPITSSSKPVVTGPFVAFKDGQYEVGTGNGMVAPGVYRTTVPSGFGCYWERQRDLSGSIEAILANDNHKVGEPVSVEIAATDKGFKTQGCGEWKKS